MILLMVKILFIKRRDKTLPKLKRSSYKSKRTSECKQTLMKFNNSWMSKLFRIK